MVEKVKERFVSWFLYVFNLSDANRKRPLDESGEGPDTKKLYTDVNEAGHPNPKLIAQAAISKYVTFSTTWVRRGYI